MIVVPADSETEPFRPAYLAPKLVCVQFDDGSGPRVVTRRRGALNHVRRLLTDPRYLIVGHSVAYDCAVWAAEGLAYEVRDAMRAGRIHCTWVFERLGEVSGHGSRKNLDLATCLKAHGLPAPALKGEGLETGFGQFLDADEIPEPYRSYALGDLAVGKLYERQRRQFHDVPLHALARLTYRQYYLQRMSVWGMRVDVGAAEALRREAEEGLHELRGHAKAWGFIRENPKGPGGYSVNVAAVQAAVLDAYGPAACPRTKTGQPGRSELVLSEATDPRLNAFATYNGLIKTVTNDVPNLLAAGGAWVSTRYGMADTTRTTSGGSKKGSRDGVIAMQNLRTKGGVRECLRPRPGYAYYDADASGLELCTLAQCCVSLLGRRNMADAINAEKNPGAMHTLVGAIIAKCSPEEFKRRVKAKDPEAVQIRTRAKNANFGFAGGLGAAKFVDYIRLLSKGKTIMTLGETTALKEHWKRGNPDGAAWLRYVGETGRDDGLFDAYFPGYGITRKNVWYCAAANGPFQALAAAVMSEVIIDVGEACDFGVLSGAHPCLFVHDEIVTEVPEDAVHDFDIAFNRIAPAAALRVMPDVITVFEAEATDRFSKRAQRVVGPDGRLQVWKEAA